MAKKIPNIAFEHKNAIASGVEILTLDSIRNRVDNLDHNPEKAHQLSFNLLVYYTKGKGKHLIDFIWHDVKENTLVHLVKDQINAFQLNNNLEGYLIVFTDEYLKEQLSKLPSNEIVRLFNPHLFSPILQISNDSDVKSYIEMFFKEFQQNKNESIKNRISESLFNIIFSKLEEIKQHQTFHVKPTDKLHLFLKFKNLVAKNFSKSRNADFYALKLNVTYKHLNTICKEVINTTAKAFIDEYVVLEAKRRLINSSIKSNELAFQIGFQEPTNFIKYFKKLTGFTPNQFKNKYK